MGWESAIILRSRSKLNNLWHTFKYHNTSAGNVQILTAVPATVGDPTCLRKAVQNFRLKNRQTQETDG